MTVFEEAIYHLTQADTLIIGGTSLVVYPAASLIQYFRGKNLILINKSVTSQDNYANLVIRDSIGKAFSQLKYVFVEENCKIMIRNNKNK